MPTGDPEPLAPDDDPHAELRRRIEASRVRFRLDELVGMTVRDAKAIVEGAGGMFARDDHPLTAIFSPQRVVVSVADGRVTGATIG